jgi:hypothetical protein
MTWYELVAPKRQDAGEVDIHRYVRYRLLCSIRYKSVVVHYDAWMCGTRGPIVNCPGLKLADFQERSEWLLKGTVTLLLILRLSRACM